MRKRITCLVLLLAAAACAPQPTPTPLPTSTPVARPTMTAAPFPTLTRYEDLGVPGCSGFTVLVDPVQFTWEGLEEVKDAGDWGYYRCASSASDTAAFYKEKMVKPPYNWQEFNWVELPAGTLGVYFHTVFQKWLYLWFLPGASGTTVVSAVRDVAEPLALPCCE